MIKDSQRPFRQTVVAADGRKTSIRLPRQELSEFRKYMLDKPESKCRRAEWANGTVNPRIAVLVAYARWHCKILKAGLEGQRREAQEQAGQARKEMERTLSRIRQSENEIDKALDRIRRNFEEM